MRLLHSSTPSIAQRLSHERRLLYLHTTHAALASVPPDIATTSTSREKTAVHGCHIATANNVFVLPPYHAAVGIQSNLT